MRPSLLPILAGLLVSAVPALADTAPASHTGAAAPVQLDQRAAIHAGYARLVFAGIKGAAAVPFRAGAENGTLTVRFQQPVRFALAPLEKGLAGYATHLALSPDGLTLTASLTKSVEVRQAVADPTTLVVDLVAVPKPAQAARVQAPKPPASRQTAAAAPKPVPAVPLRMRIASSASLDRLSFGLPRHIDFHASETANPGPVNRATIAFDRPVRLNVDRLNTQLPQALRPFTLADDGSSFSFALPAGRHLQTDRQGSRVTVTIGPAAPGPGVMVIAPPPPPPPPPPPKPALVPVKVAKAPVVPPPPTLPPQIGLEAIAPPSGVLGGGSDLRLFWTQTDDGLSLRFDWHDPVSAAVFRRGPAIWIVFDRAASLDLSQFEAQNLPVLTAIQRVPTDTGMALRLTVWNGFNASVRRAGSAWLIDLKNEPQRADAPVMPDFQNAGTGAALVFPALDPAGPVRLTDPDAGDTLIAVPLPQLGQGVQDPIEIPDIVTLASAQGLAFRPISDQLSIQSDPADVAISSVDGLTFSSFLDRRALPHQTAEGADLFHFADWVGPASRDFTQQRLFLQNAIQAAPEADRDAARLDLAKFYIANAMGAEALGVLAAIQRESPEAFDEPLLRALRGVAENLMNRNPAAVADFADKNLDGRKDAVLWRGAIAADQGDWTAAAADYEKAKDLLPSYPARLRRRLDLKFAEALVDAGRHEEAKAPVQDVLDSDPIRGESDAAKVLAGRIAAVEGDTDKAMALWHEVDASPLSSLARAEAGYALVLADLQIGKINRRDAIQDLDRLRFSWRGDDFEVRMLRKLGELQIEDGDYRDGFGTLRKVPTDFPDSPYAGGIADEMQRDFTDLFIGKTASSVPAVTALALYDEFKELTPSGPLGDAVVHGLADRLVSVDLLDRASALLADQLNAGSLSGLDRARVSTQLAVVQLLNSRPQDAAGTLGVVLDTPPPPAMAQRRRELLGEALLQLGRNDDALKAIDGDTSPDADRLRADIYWKTHNWQAVATLLLKQMKPPAADGSVNGDTANQVMNVATAMVLDGDQAGLSGLEKRYGAAMAATDQKSDFQALAGGGVPDPSTLANLGDQVGDLQSFLTTYRQRIASGSLNAID